MIDIGALTISARTITSTSALFLSNSICQATLLLSFTRSTRELFENAFPYTYQAESLALEAQVLNLRLRLSLVLRLSSIARPAICPGWSQAVAL